jgi:hypothetical protein
MQMTRPPARIEDTQHPEIHAIREHAVIAGAIDPLTLRFRILHYRESTGELIGVRGDDLGFGEAVTRARGLIERHSDSHFYLEPVAFVQ